MTTSVEIINLLQDNGFRRKENVAERYIQMSPKKKQQFLDSLADVYSRNRATILSGCQAPLDSFSAYPEQDGSRSIQVGEIKQFALYTDQLLSTIQLWLVILSSGQNLPFQCERGKSKDRNKR